MMALLICRFYSSPTKPLLALSLLTSTNPSSLPLNQNQPIESSLCLSKRALILSFSSVSFFYGVTPYNNISRAQLPLRQDDLLELEQYTDSKEGFTFLRPSSWNKVDKAGASVLFEEANKGSNNVGVVVNPVRLNSLTEYGTPEFVADKLIQAEKRKESTNDAELIRVGERSGKEGVKVYEIEYKVDSSRGGIKRVFSAAFVASKKLYLLNIAYSDKPEKPLDNHTRTILEQVLHSFDTANNTS